MSSDGMIMIASLSFEERCTGAIKKSISSNFKISEIAMLDYKSSATPGTEASELRNKNWNVVNQIADKIDVPCNRVEANAYSMDDLEDIVANKLGLHSELLFDISCMTRPHVLGLAASLARLPKDKKWRIAYTKPMTYGDLNAPKAAGGWNDTLWLPLGDDASLENQGLAVGLIASGHEAARTSIALKEIEPSCGLVIVPTRVDRPDLHRVILDKNDSLFRFLNGLRVAGPRGEKAESHFKNGGWEIEHAKMENIVADISQIVIRAINAAMELESPVVLVPFGPKLVVFISAWMLAKEYADRSWAIYPVAKTHPLAYSDGILDTEFVSSEELEFVYQSYLDRNRS